MLSSPNLAGGPLHVLQSLGRETEGRAFDARIAARLAGFLRPYARPILLAVLAMLAASALGLASPWLLKVAIDRDIPAGDARRLAHTAALLAGSFLGVYLLTAVQRGLIARVGNALLAGLRSRLMRRLQQLELAWHDRHISGVTVSRVVNDVAVINDLLSQGLVTLFGDAAILAGIVAVMIAMDARLALLTFTVLPVMVAVTALFSRAARGAFRTTRARIAAVVGDLAESIGGMRVIQAFAREDAARRRFRAVNRANRDANVEATSLSFLYLPAIDLLAAVATAIVLWFGGRAVVGGGLTVGTVVAFLSYVSRFFQPVLELSQLTATMQAAMAGGERVFELLDAEPAVRDASGAPDLPPLRGRIELAGVDFHYEPGAPVLRGVDLVIEPGQTVALVGKTGAGKSTIAGLVARFHDPTSGAVLVDGIDLRTVSQRSLRRQMAFVHQDPFLFAGTIADNIRFGRPEASDAEVEAAARAANAHEFIARLPEGYATRVLEGAANLSLGQRQLVCIARAVLVDPRILVMDEATANIDTVTERLIQRALARLLAGRTALVIAHRLSTVRAAHLICVVDGGRIVERGTHGALMARGGAYARLYEQQYGTA